MTGLTDEDIQSLATHILAETLRLALQRMAATPPPAPDSDTITTTAEVIALPEGSEVRSFSGDQYRRTPAGVIRLKDGRIYGPEGVSLPAIVTRRPEPEPQEGILTTILDLRNQKRGTVIQTRAGSVFLKNTDNTWQSIGVQLVYTNGDIPLPARVLS